MKSSFTIPLQSKTILVACLCNKKGPFFLLHSLQNGLSSCGRTMGNTYEKGATCTLNKSVYPLQNQLNAC